MISVVSTASTFLIVAVVVLIGGFLIWRRVRERRRGVWTMLQRPVSGARTSHRGRKARTARTKPPMTIRPGVLVPSPGVRVRADPS